MAHVQIDDIPFTVSFNVGATPRTIFAFDFSFFENTDLIVELGSSTLGLGTDYTVTGAGVTGAGVVTLLEAVTDATVTITRDLPIARTTDFPDSGPLNMTALNTQLDKAIALIQQVAGGPAVSSLLDEIEAIRDAALLAASSLGGNLVTGYAVTPEMFGADGTAAADTAGIQAAISSGANRIYYQPRVYLINRPGIQLTSGNQAHIGAGMGLTIFRAAQNLAVNTTSDFFNALSVDYLSFEGITFDGNDFIEGATIATPGVGDGFDTVPISRYPGTLPCIFIQGCHFTSVRNCEFIGWDTAALLYVTGGHHTVAGNVVVRSTAEPTYPNQAISFGGASALDPLDYINIIGNYVENSNISGTAKYYRMDHNVVVNNSNGAALNIAGVGWVGWGSISYNIVVGSIAAFDFTPYAPSGIENFGAYTTLNGNVILGQYGSGINNFAPHCTVSNNVVLNNGVGAGVGIWMLAGNTIDGPVQADYCVVTGNRSGDTRAGGAKTQNYGYYENPGSALVGVKVYGNNFSGNKLGDEIYDGSGTESPTRPWVSYTVTPISSTGGTIGTGVTATGSYLRVGKQIKFTVRILIGATGAGTGSGGVRFNLPATATSTSMSFPAHDAGTFIGLFARLNESTALADIYKIDNTYPGTNNAILVCSGEYAVP